MSHEDLRIVVGLGNPGSEYTHTRHNIGFMILNKLAEKHSANFKNKKNLFGQIAEIRNGTKQLRLLLPETYMNNSGQAIRACLNWYDIEISQILVLVDDMDLPLGRLRLRTSGGSGGHKGLLSTIQHLQTENFPRLRVGIGAPAGLDETRKLNTVSHVLGNFSKEEQPVIEKVLDEVIIGIDLIQQIGFIKASNQLNRCMPLQNEF